MKPGRREVKARLVALLLATVAGMTACFPFEKRIAACSERFRRAHPDGLRTVTSKGHPFRYAVVGKEGGPVVLFIHGSPGSWEAWSPYLTDETLTAKARLVAVDRAGYGASEPGVAVPSLEEQAARIAGVLREEGRAAVVVGHSLGGPIACRLAADHPDLVGGLLLLAPSIDPNEETTKWFQVPAKWRWVRPMLPAALDVCNQEILPLKDELTRLGPALRNLSCDIVVIQGLTDGLVPPGNADYAESVFAKERLKVIRLPGQGHFIPWEREDLVKEVLEVRLRGSLADSR